MEEVLDVFQQLCVKKRLSFPYGQMEEVLDMFQQLCVGYTLKLKQAKLHHTGSYGSLYFNTNNKLHWFWT